MYRKKIPEYAGNVPEVPDKKFPGTYGTCTPFTGISYEKIVQEKDSGKYPQSARSARK
jgi:hypothetical protein